MARTLVIDVIIGYKQMSNSFQDLKISDISARKLQLICTMTRPPWNAVSIVLPHPQSTPSSVLAYTPFSPHASLNMSRVFTYQHSTFTAQFPI